MYKSEMEGDVKIDHCTKVDHLDEGNLAGEVHPFGCLHSGHSSLALMRYSTSLLHNYADGITVEVE